MLREWGHWWSCWDQLGGQELGVAVVPFLCGWDGTLWSILQNKRWNWSRKSALPFPSMFVQSWESSGWGSLRDGAELWKSLPVFWGCGDLLEGTGRENTGTASCCQQDDMEEESVLEPFWAAFAVVELLGLPLCSSRQKVERLVMQYLRTGSDPLW